MGVTGQRPMFLPRSAGDGWFTLAGSANPRGPGPVAAWPAGVPAVNNGPGLAVPAAGRTRLMTFPVSLGVA